MKNIISIDLTKYTDVELKVVSDELKLDYEWLLRNKNNHSVCKAFIDCGDNSFSGNTMFAYTLNSDPDKIVYFNEKIDSMLNSIPNYEIKVPGIKILTDVDAILEKITKYGVDSLFSEEREILNKVK